MPNNVEILSRLKVFISSGCGKGKEKYNKIRKILKNKIEETGFATVYLWEDDNRASTLPAQQVYLREIDECHVCIFLIDNKDGVFPGVAPEIQRAKSTHTKSIYLFCTENSTEPTWVEKELYGPNGAKFYEISSFSDFPNSAYNSLMNDIADIYYKYCRNWLIDSELSVQEKSIRQINPVESLYLKKILISNLDKTKIYLSKSIFDNNRKEKETSPFDELCCEFLKVVLGEKTFLEFNPNVLLLELKEMQSYELYSVVSKRWNAVTAYFTNNLSKCSEYLKEALKMAKEHKVPDWIISDILIDLRNIENLKFNTNNKYLLNNKAQIDLDNQSIPVYYPLLDRLNYNFYEELEGSRNKESIQSPYTANFGNNIDLLSDYIASIFAITVFNGSITQTTMIYTRLKDLAFYLYNRYNQWQFCVMLLKYTAIETNRKTMDKTVKAFNEILGKINASDAIKIYNMANAEPIFLKKFIIKLSVIESLGYFFSDYDYSTITEAILKEIYIWINSDQPNMFLSSSIFKMFYNNHLRMNNDKIIDICIIALQKGYCRFWDDIFDIVSIMRVENLSLENKKSLIDEFSSILCSENKNNFKSNFQYAVINLRKTIPQYAEKFDNYVKENMPNFYRGVYSLELFSESKDELINHIEEYISQINNRNEEQGKFGTYRGYATNPYLTIKNILQENLEIANYNLLDKIIETIKETLLSEYQTLSDKCYAFDLLIFLKNSYKEYGYGFGEFNKAIKDKQNIILFGKDMLLEKSSQRIINLNYFLYLLSCNMVTNAQVVEVCASFSNAEDFENIEAMKILSGYFQVAPINKLELCNVYPILSFVLSFCHNSQYSVRYYAISAMINMLSDSTYKPIISYLSDFMNFESPAIKCKIIRQIDNIKEFDKTAAEGILQKAKTDTNFIVRRQISLLSQK
ncbi:TPA: DUF4062 domain-containing protein [Clostridium botulinum]|nr:DUF4062 domain-containing protein [Clostridium botulinum]